jgi:DNA-binding NarL/FixJ family response regulator
MTPINVVVIDHSRPGAPDCTAWLDDDHEIHIAARSSQVDDTGALCASYHPDVLLVSTRCLQDSNRGWLSDVQRHSAATRVILIDDALTDDALVDCLGTGAHGWVETNDAPLVGKAVHAVHLGEAWVSRKLARRLVDRLIERERGKTG